MGLKDLMNRGTLIPIILGVGIVATFGSCIYKTYSPKPRSSYTQPQKTLESKTK